jgi:hypothetical protein
VIIITGRRGPGAREERVMGGGRDLEEGSIEQGFGMFLRPGTMGSSFEV